MGSPPKPWEVAGAGYGGYGGSMYGGLGGMGGMGYGGMGYGGAYGGMGMSPYGMNPMMDPNNPSLTQSLEASTQQTFALLQSIVQTFGGFAQMLESTYMATHSSFFAMVGVAEQLGNLRNALGTVLGLFGLLRWAKDVLTGKRPSANGGLNGEFGEFISRPPGAPPPNPNAPRPSRKPFLIFLAAIVGIPYLMHRLIRSLQARLPPPNRLDPNKLPFARAIYPFHTQDPVELNLEKGDVLAVLQTADPMTGVEGDWWRGRLRSGREGWFPKTYVELVKRPEETKVKTVD
ncbi:hypothetical protein SISSUDRAFT_1016857 [Sistotremastrum suecicum HHB10207 ss-3]|uniref:Peroxisomal membrane protein PEX13 n=1 Tax=Sistotremastrum suecicum HHB10207 ss-3 TaxID=1314776 RepID=A0A166GKF1_9AGAM|nr:hypothetical protein SISSUDRAFT_1016857 [Sistotremastrum suecicum HHB10207 ss-3]